MILKCQFNWMGSFAKMSKLVYLFVLFCKINFIICDNNCKLITTTQIRNKKDDNSANELKDRLNNAFQKTDGSKTISGYSLNCSGIFNGSVVLCDWSSVSVDMRGSDGTWSVLNFTSRTPSCNGTQLRKTNVIMGCDPNDEITQIRWTQDDPTSCSCIFYVSAKVFCEKFKTTADKPAPAASDTGGGVVTTQHTTTSSGSHIGGVGAFFLVVFLLISGYFLFGFLYKRYVLGAQGYEQVPHYLFWRRLLRAVQAPMTGAQYQRPSSNDPSYRNYDDSDEFRYDQPPLMPDNRPDSTPAGGQNRFLSRSATNNAKDESDVRLLVV